ncbi:MAG: hypothetical protein ACE5J9_03030 [Methanosarcinales archaeon]
MEKEDIIELVRREVVKEFGESRIREIKAFGPYECEDLNVVVLVEGIKDRKETYKVHSRLFDMLDELGLDVPLAIMNA